MRIIRVGKAQKEIRLYTINEMQDMSCEQFVAVGNSILNGDALIAGRSFDFDLLRKIWQDVQNDPDALKRYRSALRVVKNSDGIVTERRV